MGKELKIYVIEDTPRRREGIQEYFDSVNRLLDNKNSGATSPKLSSNDFENCQECFEQRAISKVNICWITPKMGRGQQYFNYYFTKNGNWVKEIEKILKKDELRIFLIDLALNEKERNTLNNNESIFSADTAKAILNFINENTRSKEYIIFESVAKYLNHRLNAILRIIETDLDKIHYKYILGQYFNSTCSVEDKVLGISSTFGEMLEVMCNDKAN